MDRINILHLSDLHLDHENLFETSVVLKALQEQLKQLRPTHWNPHLVIFTGDIVKSGDSVESYEAVLNVFTNVCDALSLPFDRFIFVPGNHDLSREAVRLSLDELVTFRQSTVSREQLNRLAEAGQIDKWADLHFQPYRMLQGIWELPRSLLDDPHFNVYSLDELSLNVVAINTAWTSTAGLGPRDEKALLFAEFKLDRALTACNPSFKTIVIGHHPLSWLADSCASDMQRLMHEHTAAYLSGHLHHHDPSQIHRPAGDCFLNQSGALYTYRKDRHIGFSVLSLSKSAPHVEINSKTYHDNGHFYPNSEVGTDGVFYSSDDAEAFWANHPERVNEAAWQDWLHTEVKRTLVESFSETAYGRTLQDVFIEPTLSKLDNAREQRFKDYRDSLITSEAILTDENNYIIASRREFGRTTYLKFLASKASEITRRLPIQIAFNSIRLGTNPMMRALRSGLPEKLLEGMPLERMLKLGRCILIIDDIDPEKKKEFALLKDFLTEYSSNKFILSMSEVFQPMLTGGWFSPELPIKTHVLHIQPFGKNQLRRLVRAWHKCDDALTEKLLTRVLSDIVRINLPVTPVNGSILLSILEKEPDFEAINRSIIVTQFVEMQLGKYGAFESFRGTFDFGNKRHLLAYIAQQMVKLGSYMVPVETMLRTITDYMREFDFDFVNTSVLDELLKGRIFSMNEGEVGFYYRCYLEYFVASAMDLDAEFRSYVLDNDRYLQFSNEIEFYAGLRRTDHSLLTTLQERLEALSAAQVAAGEWSPDLALFENLAIHRDRLQSLADSVSSSLQAPALTDEERDSVAEGEIPRDVGRRQEVYRPGFTHDSVRWIYCLMLYCRVLRNLEGVSAIHKRDAINRALYKWAELAAFQLSNAELIARKRKIKINGVLYEVMFGEDMTDDEMLYELYYAIPYKIFGIIREMMGSEKLKVTLARPLGEAEKEPLIVTFLRIGHYADMKLEGYADKLAVLSRNVSTAEYLQSCLLSKVRYLFRLGTEDDQERLRPVLVELLRATLPGGSADKTAKVASEIEQLSRDALMTKHFVIDSNGEGDH